MKTREKSRITIKDVANAAGVSIATVHCALSGKPGVGDETRMRVEQVAHQLEYRPNALASSLRSKTRQVAVAFPGPSGDNLLYFSRLWEGYRTFMSTVSDFGINMIEVPYYTSENSQSKELFAVANQTNLDGVITFGNMDIQTQQLVSRFSAGGVPVILVGGGIDQPGVLCSVQPHYILAGKMMAELLVRQIPEDGAILVCAGDVILPTHYLVVQGMEMYLNENGYKNPLKKLYGSKDKETDYDRIVHAIEETENLSACVSVHARASVLLGNALLKTGKAGKIPAIGSDIFSENTQFLKDGVFSNLLHKNPFYQAYVATKCMTDLLLYDIRPIMTEIYTNSEIIFKSTLPMYENATQGLIL